MITLGVSAALMHPDPRRSAYHASTLAYVDEALVRWLEGPGVYTQLLVRTSTGSPTLAERVARLDGLVLQGGADMAPASYGQHPLDPRWAGDAARDAFELALLREALTQGKPVLGVCRGHQLLNVAFGGTLIQDLPSQVGGEVRHGDRAAYGDNLHAVRVDPDSWLGAALQTQLGAVSSVHHQAVDQLGASLLATAWADDGVIEGIERIDDTVWAVGVQWHPEFHREDPQLLSQRRLREAFLAVVRLKAAPAPR